MSYIAVTEPQSNPFAPLTSELVKQLRDNPIAIAGGAAGAPRVRGSALQFNLLAEATLPTDATSFAITDLDPHLGLLFWSNTPANIWIIEISSNNGLTWTQVNNGNFSLSTSSFLVWSLGHGSRTGRLTIGLSEGTQGSEFSFGNGILANAVRVQSTSDFTSGTLKVYGFWRGWE